MVWVQTLSKKFQIWCCYASFFSTYKIQPKVFFHKFSLAAYHHFGSAVVNIWNLILIRNTQNHPTKISFRTNSHNCKTTENKRAKSPQDTLLPAKKGPTLKTSFFTSRHFLMVEAGRDLKVQNFTSQAKKLPFRRQKWTTLGLEKEIDDLRCVKRTTEHIQIKLTFDFQKFLRQGVKMAETWYKTSQSSRKRASVIGAIRERAAAKIKTIVNRVHSTMLVKKSMVPNNPQTLQKGFFHVCCRTKRMG